MRGKWVMMLALALLLTACAQEPAPSTSPTPQPPTNATTQQNVTPPAPVEKPAETGRAVFVVTDKPPKPGTVESFVIELTDLEVHQIVPGEDEGQWRKLTSAKTTFNLTEIKDSLALLLDIPLEPGIYTQLRFRLADADAVIAGTEYDLETPGNIVKLVSRLEIEQGRTSTATLDFDANKSIFLAGEQAYFKPTIRIVTRKGATVETKNRTVTITNGAILTDEEQTPDRIYTTIELNNSRNGCMKDCNSFCAEQSQSGCVSTCREKTASGCESEDEDYCRKTCEPYLHPVDCRDGCRQDDSAECTDYLDIQCSLGCNTTKTDCTASCTTDC